MLMVEMSVRTLERERAKLQGAKGEHSQLYARGAIDVLDWILNGKPEASQGGESQFPVIIPMQEH